MLPRHLFDAAIFLAVILAGVAAIGERTGRSSLPTPHSSPATFASPLLPAALFLGITALSWFWTVDAYLTRNEFFRVASAVAMLWMIAWLATRWTPTVVLVAAAIVVGGAAAGALGFRQWFLNVLFQHTWTWRTFGTFGSPNSLAGHLVLVLPLALALLRSATQRWQRWLAVLAVAFIAVAIPLTASKAAFVALVFSLAFYAVLVSPGRWRSRLGWGLLVAAGLFAAILVIPGLRERFAAGFTTQNHSWMFRLYVWQGTLRAIADHWLLGTGAGTFRVAYLAHAPTDFTSAAHQGFLQIAMETGVFGLLAFLGVLVAWAHALGRTMKSEKGGRSSQDAPRSTLHAPRLERELSWGAAAGVAASCIHSLFDYDWTIYPTFLALFAVLGLSTSGIRNSEFGIRDSGFVIRRSRMGHLALVIIGLGLLLTTVLGAGAQGLLVSAKRSLQRQAYLVAADKLGRASQLDGRCGDIWRALAFVPTLGPMEVETALRGAVRAEPRAPIYRCDLADFLADQGRSHAAVLEYRRALVAFPNYTRAMLELCRVAQEHGESDLLLETVLRLHRLEDQPYGRYKAVPERPSLEFLYAHAGLIEAAAEGARIPADLVEHSHQAARTFGQDYLARERALRDQVTRAYPNAPDLQETTLALKGFTEGKGKQVRTLLSMIEWRSGRARGDGAALQRARDLDADAVAKLEAGTWAGVFVETRALRREAGIL